MADSARGIWAQADTLRVKRDRAGLDGRGKLMPLHLTAQGEFMPALARGRGC